MSYFNLTATFSQSNYSDCDFVNKSLELTMLLWKWRKTLHMNSSSCAWMEVFVVVVLTLVWGIRVKGFQSVFFSLTMYWVNSQRQSVDVSVCLCVSVCRGCAIRIASVMHSWKINVAVVNISLQLLSAVHQWALKIRREKQPTPCIPDNFSFDAWECKQTAFHLERSG